MVSYRQIQRFEMDNHNIYQIIAKVLAEDANYQEQVALDNWLTQDKNNQEEFLAIKKGWQDTRTKIVLDQQELETAFNKVINHKAQPQIVTEKKIGFYWYYKVAAAVIFLIIGGLFIFNLSNFSTEQPKVAESGLKIIEKIVNKGQKLKIHLPDGSIVWLNSESKLIYPDRFNDSVREVNLTGEAFFEVVRNENKPFIVNTGNIYTRVLGTSFNVKSYGGKVNVALVSGKVRVSDQNNQSDFLLKPGEAIQYSSENEKYTLGDFDIKQAAGWKDGILYFENAGFNEVVETLERWYGVEIVTENFQNNPWKYSGEFQNEYLDIVLESISYSKNFEYTIDQNKVYLKF